MANSELKDKYFKIPLNVYNKINQQLKRINTQDKQAKGVKRAKDIVDAKKISYSQMKRLKNYFDGYSGDGKDDEFNLIGGDVTKQWVDKTLTHNRDGIKQGKKIRKDGGMENQFLKTHEKDNANSDPTDARGGLIDIAQSSKMDRIMGNDAIYKTSDKSNYNEEIKTIKYLIEYMSK